MLCTLLLKKLTYYLKSRKCCVMLLSSVLWSRKSVSPVIFSCIYRITSCHEWLWHRLLNFPHSHSIKRAFICCCCGWFFFFSTTAIRTLLFSSICICIVFQRVKFAEIVVFNVNVCPLRVTAYCCHILWCWSGSSCYGTYHHHYHHHHPPHRHYYHFHYHYQNYTWAVVNPVQRKTNTQACTLRTCLAFGIQ